LKSRPGTKPFCFWFGTSDPHRGYKLHSGEQSGMDLSKVKLPPYFPDDPVTRGDVADYYWEVERFDRELGEALATLEKRGELDNTIVVMTSDHGMPFPRGKSSLYDFGARVPLLVRWGKQIKGNRIVDDFVSLTDVAPTFLDAAQAKIPTVMTGKSLMSILKSGKSGRVDASRSFVLTGKERHVPCQEAPNLGGTPMRAIRTGDFLYINNLFPDRWPAGTPDYSKCVIKGGWYADTDNGPTKSYMVDNKDKDAEHARLYELSFGKRPPSELYDLKKDPFQLNNLAGNPEYSAIMLQLSTQLTAELTRTEDPRIIGGGEKFDTFPYAGGSPKFPGLPKSPKKKKTKKAPNK
jgi:arylsulfatase A-like enzyme